MQPEVAVFRHNLFKVSEVFITEQARHLRRYHPFFLGRLRHGAAPAGIESLAIADLAPRFAPQLGLPLAAWQMVSRSIAPYERLLNGRRPALIHAHFGIEGVYALPLAQKLGIPLITTFHGFDATLSTAGFLSSPAWAWYPLLRPKLIAQGNLFLCASNFIREQLLAQGFPPARTRVHYIGVDCETILPRSPEEEQNIILHVARLVEVKGTEFLIRAFAMLAPQHKQTRLVIIGDGPLRRRLVRLAADCGVGAKIDFLGALPHEKVLGWMRRAAVLAIPSVRTASGRVEGLGMVTLEAAATGVPAVGSELGGIRETILSGQTGFLVPPADTAALAARLAQILADTALRHQLGTQARQFVSQTSNNFSQSSNDFAQTSNNFSQTSNVFSQTSNIRTQTAALESLYDEVLR